MNEALGLTTQYLAIKSLHLSIIATSCPEMQSARRNFDLQEMHATYIKPVKAMAYIRHNTQ